MKNLIIIIVTLFVVSIVNSQSLTGKVVDQQNEPIAFANVVAYKKSDTTLAAGVISDDDGNFNIKVSLSDVYLEISFVGFESKKITPTNNNLGTIVLKEEGQLDEVIITARKKMIEQKVDRLVFNVENSIASQGIGGIDLLKKTPLLSFDQAQGLSIIGKGKVRVMINGRILNMNQRELTSYLQSIQSDNVKKIEVVTTPPSKYNAEGNSGLINIVLKQSTNLGLSGTVNSSIERNSVTGFRTGATLNYQNSKIRSSLKLSQYDIGFKPKGTNDFLTTNNSIFSVSNRLDDIYGFMADCNIDFQLNEKSNIGFIYNYRNSHYDMVSFNRSVYANFNVLDSTLVTNSTEKSKLPKYTITGYYDVKLDTLGKKISVEGNYYSSKSERTANFTTDVDDIENNIVKNLSNVNYNIYSGRLDLILPYAWGTLETGGKYTLFKNKSNVNYFNKINEDYILDFTKSNAFNYNEDNYAMYGSYQRNVNKWIYKLGFRYEYTILKGKNLVNNTIGVKNSYGKIFPSLYINYKHNEHNTWSFTYSKRINRPTFRNLNPYRWYKNPYKYYTGNPSLQPSYSDNLELSYSLKNKLTFKLYNEFGTNKSTNIDRLENGVYSNVLENAFDDNKTGLTISYFNTFFKVWEFSATTNIYYVKTSPKVEGLDSMNIYSTYFTMNNSVALNTDKTIFFSLNFWYVSPRVIGNFRLEDMYELAPGIKASFLDKKLNLNLIFNDVLRSIENNGYYSYTDRQANFDQYNDYQKVTFGVSYTFGNKKVKGSNKKAKIDEKHRAN